jgi:hypothetical protein
MCSVSVLPIYIFCITVTVKKKNNIETWCQSAHVNVNDALAGSLQSEES